MKELLKTVIMDQQEMVWKDSFVPRELSERFLSDNTIVVITGIRRCGKSTLLHQIRSVRKEKDYYLNFDDERLIRFTVEHFQVLHELFIELFGEQKTFYFDEIQNISGWERFVRRLSDYGYKIFITGSNARMLSRELGTHLTGRYISLELYPFSFREYLVFAHQTITEREMVSTAGRAKMSRWFSEYLTMGGFPAYLENQYELYLKSLYESILYRDVLVRNNLTNEKEVLELVYYLASNVAGLSSYNSLRKIIGIKNATTIRNYIGFIQDTYLLFQVSKYDPSLNKQVVNPKKTYFIDNSLVLKLGFSFSAQSGRLMENLVFIELKRRGKQVYYHQGHTECDFVIREGARITEVVQVCYLFKEPGVADREIRGLTEAMAQYGLKRGTIITTDTEETLQHEGYTIRVVFAWRWMMENVKIKD
jgi:hypothetical protein